jgi:hypothetical protein
MKKLLTTLLLALAFVTVSQAQYFTKPRMQGCGSNSATLYITNGAYILLDMTTNTPNLPSPFLLMSLKGLSVEIDITGTNGVNFLGSNHVAVFELGNMAKDGSYHWFTNQSFSMTVAPTTATNWYYRTNFANTTSGLDNVCYVRLRSLSTMQSNGVEAVTINFLVF